MRPSFLHCFLFLRSLNREWQLFSVKMLLKPAKNAHRNVAGILKEPHCSVFECVHTGYAEQLHFYLTSARTSCDAFTMMKFARDYAHCLPSAQDTLTAAKEAARSMTWDDVDCGWEGLEA